MSDGLAESAVHLMSALPGRMNLESSCIARTFPVASSTLRKGKHVVALLVLAIYLRTGCHGLKRMRTCPYNRGHQSLFLPNLKELAGSACLHCAT